ncbi:hypothetical protein [Thalassobacillus devorans]|uniref:hypothetical protein n=1 Tax=Thalassobacillus devorans TaxID=279813 RepID=UPI00159330FC|nr:hypothetical protein [Thalassobacillus devorans]
MVRRKVANKMAESQISPETRKYIDQAANKTFVHFLTGRRRNRQEIVERYW